MNALINLKDCREYMTITLNNKDHRIKLSGTIDDPYFCGRSLKDQEERTISREVLLTQLLSVTNTSKQSLWSQIKEFTEWKNSKTEIDEGSFRYKIVY